MKFSHTRPNGEDPFSLYEGRYYIRGENIAIGQRNKKEAFKAFAEKKESFAGQGHRRLMLNGNVTSVGIACFKVNGEKCWVQEFANPNSGMEKTRAVYGRRTVRIEY